MKSKRDTPESKDPVAVQPADFFVLRTPLLPLDELSAWSDGLRAARAAPADVEAALADDRRLLRERLRTIVERPEVREALFVASPSLIDSLPAWVERPESERGQKVERALVRYFTRMTARPTPFGLFAGCAVGRCDAETELLLGARADYRRHTRLDGDYLQTLTERLGADAELRAALVYRPNSSLYSLGGQLRYAESRLVGKVRSYRLSVVEPSDYLLATLARAADGARLGELAAALVDDEVTRAEADAFVAQLVDSQLLQSDLQPQVTGAEPIADLVRQLEAIAGEHRPAATAAARLDQTATALRALDAAPLGVPTERYRDLAHDLEELPAAVELARLFQVDLAKPAPQATLGAAPLAELVRAVTLLHQWAQRPTELDAFTDAFLRRYEEREVPLLEALDEELGIGFGRSHAPSAETAPLLAGLPFAGGAQDEARTGALFAPLLALLDDVRRRGADELVLGDADLQRLTEAARSARGDAPPPPLPDSLAAMVTLAASDASALAAGDFRLWLHDAGGPSGANLLGRFCHGDEQLTERVRRQLADEEARRPDALFAEVVHLPEGRIGNIMLRPLLRRWELPFLGRSGAPRQQQLRLDDLTLALRKGRLQLRSRSLDREVLPRLTSAHNHGHTRNLGLYRFLCALQRQGQTGVAFHWGALEAARFLPRVRTGRVVLSLARWRVTAAELEPLVSAKGQRQFAAAQALRLALALPRWVALTDDDNVLPIDLENALSIDALAQLAKERRQLVLTELFGHDGLCVRGPEGRFTHELLVPLTANADRPLPERRDEAPPVSTDAPAPSLPRLFPPGSEWLYAKLYTGTATADLLLLDVVEPLVRAARQEGAIDDWFFIRFGDPDWHLRLRFRGDPARLRTVVQPLLEAAATRAIAGGRAWRLQYDTYAREIERYGGDAGMVLAEQMFGADSDLVLALTPTLAADELARWRLTLRGLDQLLDDFGFTSEEQLALLARLRDGYAREQRAHGALEQQVGAKFRQERLALEALLDRARDGDSALAPQLALIDARSARLRPLCASLRRRAAAGRLTASLEELAMSQLHMHATRMLHATARQQEYVLYDFLERLHRGRRARMSCDSPG